MDWKRHGLEDMDWIGRHGLEDMAWKHGLEDMTWKHGLEDMDWKKRGHGLTYAHAPSHSHHIA